MLIVGSMVGKVQPSMHFVTSRIHPSATIGSVDLAPTFCSLVFDAS